MMPWIRWQSRRVFLRARTLPALLLLICLCGCDVRGRDPSAPTTADPSSPAYVGEWVSPGRKPGSDHTPTVRPPQMSEAELAEIRSAVQRSGGTLRGDAQGQPLEIDFLASRASVDPAAWQAILRCPALEVLRVRAAQIPASDLAGVCRLTDLRQLHLHDAAVSDALIKDLASSARQLAQLSLRNTPELTDRGVAELAALPELTHLALLEQQITGAATKSLANMSQLQALDLRMSHNVHAADLAVLASLPKLTELKLGGYAIDDAVLSTVAQFPQLHSLTIEDASIGAAGLAHLAAGPAAAQVDELAFVRCAGLTDDACLVLKNFPRLAGLSLRDVPVTGRFLQQLPHRDQLQRLALSQTYVTAEAIDALSACSRLRRLDLSRTFLNLDLTERLAGLSGLEYLDLSECGLDDAMIAPVVEMKQLKTLIVDGNPGLSPDVTAKIGAH